MARLSFRFTRRPATEPLASLAILAAGIGAMRVPGADRAWAAFVESTSVVVQIAVVPWLLHLAMFWSLSLGFHYVDTHDRPAWIARHRIQSGPPRKPELGKVLRNLAVNQLFWSPVMLLVIGGLLELRGWSPSSELPSIPRLLAELAGVGALSVVWFYATHRFLHRKWWMHHVHRVHHEFRTTTAMAAEYAHWFEFTVGSFGTMGVGVVLLAPSLPAIYLFTALAVFTVLVHHCGYALPWVSWPVHHDWHHFRVKECFGTLGVLDHLLGTDEEFRTLKHGEER